MGASSERKAAMVPIIPYRIPNIKFSNDANEFIAQVLEADMPCACNCCHPFFYNASCHQKFDTSQMNREIRGEADPRARYEPIELAEMAIQYAEWPWDVLEERQKVGIKQFKFLWASYKEALGAPDARKTVPKEVLDDFAQSFSRIFFPTGRPHSFNCWWGKEEDDAYGQQWWKDSTKTADIELNPTAKPRHIPVSRLAEWRIGGVLLHECIHGYFDMLRCRHPMCPTRHVSNGDGGHGRAMALLYTGLLRMIPKLTNIWLAGEGEDGDAMFLGELSHNLREWAKDYQAMPSVCDVERCKLEWGKMYEKMDDWAEWQEPSG